MQKEKKEVLRLERPKICKPDISVVVFNFHCWNISTSFSTVDIDFMLNKVNSVFCL